jgi:hypothetical protein
MCATRWPGVFGSTRRENLATIDNRALQWTRSLGACATHFLQIPMRGCLLSCASVTLDGRQVRDDHEKQLVTAQLIARPRPGSETALLLGRLALSQDADLYLRQIFTFPLLSIAYQH